MPRQTCEVESIYSSSGWEAYTVDEEGDAIDLINWETYSWESMQTHMREHRVARCRANSA